MQFYCECFGMTLHDAATLAQEKDNDKETVW